MDEAPAPLEFDVEGNVLKKLQEAVRVLGGTGRWSCPALGQAFNGRELWPSKSQGITASGFRSFSSPLRRWSNSITNLC